MGSRPTDAEVLAKLDAADGPVTHVLLKDVCVSRLRDAVECEAGKDAEIERLREGLIEMIEWAKDIAGDCDIEDQRNQEYEMMDRMKTLANYEQEKTVIRNTLREERDQLLRKNSQLISVLRWARSTLRQRQDASKVLLERIDDALKKTGEQQ